VEQLNTGFKLLKLYTLISEKSRDLGAKFSIWLESAARSQKAFFFHLALFCLSGLILSSPQHADAIALPAITQSIDTSNGPHDGV
jgi:hypothetical protein